MESFHQSTARTSPTTAAGFVAMCKGPLRHQAISSSSVVNLPPGLSFSGGIISGTLSVAGVYNLGLQVVCAGGVVEAGLNLTVQTNAVAQSHPPVIQGSVSSVAVDSSGNQYVVGQFSGTVDFNPGVGVDGKVSMGGSTAAFVTRFNVDGTYAWTQTFGGSNFDYANGVYASGVAVNGTRIYVAGSFRGSAQVGGAGTAEVSAGSFDAFVLSLDTATGVANTAFGGNGVITFGGTGVAGASGVAVSGTRVYVVGGFQGSAQVGGAGTAEVSAGGSFDSDAFVLSLDAATGAADTAFGGNSVMTFGGTGDDRANRLLKNPDF